MQVQDTLKKISALAGSTLMVGMTLGSAASLADFPGRFINNQGAMTADVVVGSQGSVADVVGAVQIGAALGQSSLRTGRIRDTKTVEVPGAGSWTTDGTTLDSRNDDLHFGDTIDAVRQTLTEDDLDALAETTFQDAAGNSQDVEQYLYVGGQAVGFGNPGDTDDEDPFLYVDSPSSVSASSYLYRLQANMGDGLELSDTSQDDNKNDDVLGEDIELFGKSFTISEDSFTSGSEGQLILYGSSQEYDLETGESTEFEVNGNTHTLEVRAVTDSETAAFYLDGELREKTEGSTVNVDGTDVRLSDVIQTSSQNSEGLVTFAIGSEEYVFQDGDPIEDGDGNDIEGTHVSLTGSSVGSANTLADDVEVSSVEVSVGAADSDDSYVAAEETFEDPVFNDIVFRFGGLLPDAAEQEEPGVSFGTDGDDFLSVDAETEDGSLSTNIVYGGNYTTDENSDPVADLHLAHDSGADIVVVEGQSVEEDDYMVMDAGGFSHLWEVTGIDEDTTSGGLSSDDEATIDLRDRVSGDSVTVDLDADTSEDVYEGTEVIDGQTYGFELQKGTSPTFTVGWGGGSHGVDTSSVDSFSVGDETTVFPALDLDSGAALSLVDTAFGVQGVPSPTIFDFRSDDLVETTLSDANDYTTFINLTGVRNEKSIRLNLTGQETTGAGYARSINVTGGSAGSATASLNASLTDVTVSVATTSPFNVTIDYVNSTAGGNGDTPFEIASLNVTAAGETGQVDAGVGFGDSPSGSYQRQNVEPASKTFGDDLLLPSTESSSEKGLGSGEEVTFESVDGSATADVSGSGYDVVVAGQSLNLSVDGTVVDEPGALVVEEEDDDDTEEVYLETPAIDASNDRLDVADVTYSGSDRDTAELESDSDVTVGYDRFGAYTWFDSDERGEADIYLPEDQSTVGAAFTGAGDTLARSASGQQRTRIEYRGVKNNRIRGRLPAFASVDSEVTQQQRQDRHLILVGGPAVNQLVADLAGQHDEVWTVQEWRDSHQGEAVLQLVEDAFADGRNALIVAGHSADDTVRAARYISSWKEHRSGLRGESLHTVE